jgi:hypothetical protein
MNSIKNNELSKEDKQSLSNAIATVQVEGSIVTEADVLKILNSKTPVNRRKD